MKLNTLRDLYVEELQDLHSAESQIIRALPKMIERASSPSLHDAFETDLKVAKAQLKRLERILAGLGEQPAGKKCRGIEGILEEAKTYWDAEGADRQLRDIGLIAVAQRVEHYEMAGYGCVRAYAEQLGFADAAKLLQQTLDEEANADEGLAAIAERLISGQAAGSGTDSEMDMELELDTAPARRK